MRIYGNWRGYDDALGDYEAELLALPGLYQPPTGGLILATISSDPVGCVAFRPQSAGTCELKRMFVLPAFRKRKIGQKLLYSALSFAFDLGYGKIRLDTHPKMKAAIHLYLRAGFQEIERYNNNPTPGIRFFERALP